MSQSDKPISPLRQCMIDDMTLRKLPAFSLTATQPVDARSTASLGHKGRVQRGEVVRIREHVAKAADGKGSEANNLKLSQKRAESVKAYLVAHGIEASRLGAQGYGKSKPIGDNSADEGREQSRRVELKVVGGATPAAAEAVPANAGRQSLGSSGPNKAGRSRQRSE